ncbi:MAG TPA: hypothetical protein VFW07_01605 [Parafilimonas sp.]|nr:hypothetical protein [Parafilimonas sp.]
MKPVLYFIMLVFCMNLIAIKTKAQHAGIFIHAIYAAPMGGISNDFYSYGGGFEGGILAGKKSTRFAGSIGYSRFFADDKTNIYGDKSYVPVKVGLRQYLPLNFVFLQADAGIGFVSEQHADDSATPFAYDFQAGVKFSAFEAAIGWDTFHAKNLSGWSSWFTVKAGINLGF